MRQEGFQDSMITVYNKGNLGDKLVHESFQDVRKRVAREWMECEESFKDSTTGEWRRPLHRTMLDVQDEEAATAEAKALDETTGKPYKSPPDLYADKTYNKVNEAIAARLAALEAKQASNSASQSSMEVVDDLRKAAAEWKQLLRKS